MKLTFTALSVIMALMLSACDTVTEYKCSPEQIEKAKSQFEWCKSSISSTPPSKRVGQCWSESTRAHCEIVREFKRTGVDLNEINQTQGN